MAKKAQSLFVIGFYTIQLEEKKRIICMFRLCVFFLKVKLVWNTYQTRYDLLLPVSGECTFTRLNVNLFWIILGNISWVALWLSQNTNPLPLYLFSLSEWFMCCSSQILCLSLSLSLCTFAEATTILTSFKVQHPLKFVDNE